MGTVADNILPRAEDARMRVAEVELEKAADYKRQAAGAEAEKKALLDTLKQPSGMTEDEKVELAARVISRAISEGLTEVQVYRFPNELCTDRGRTINQAEPGWENANWNSQGSIPALARPPPSPRIQDTLPSYRFSRWDAW